jgi:hypothetical protein
MHHFGRLPALTPEQFMPERFVHHLTPPSRWNQLKEFISQSIIDGHIEFGHSVILPRGHIFMNANIMRLL